MSARTSRQQRVSRALGVAFLAIGCGAVDTTTVWAQQSVSVVGGHLTVFPSRFSQFWSIVGDGIFAVGGGGDQGNPGGVECACRPGHITQMAGTFGGQSLGSGSAVVNGVPYGSVFFSGVLNFHANPSVMPDFDGNGWRNVTVPFTLGADSSLEGYADVNRTQLLFTIRPLIGKGTVTVQLFQNLDTLFYEWSSTTYTFGPGVNLLEKPGFEEYTPPALGVPGWVSDPIRQTPAYSESNQPHSGSNNGACFTTDSLDCGIY